MISFKDFILNANYENEWVKLCFVTDAKEDLRQQEDWEGKKHFTRFPDAKDFSEIKSYLNNYICVGGIYMGEDDGYMGANGVYMGANGVHIGAEDVAIKAAKLVWDDYTKQNGIEK